MLDRISGLATRARELVEDILAVRALLRDSAEASAEPSAEPSVSKKPKKT
jgi:hypothetical protein